VHLVGFIIRIYHDARSSECQKKHVEFYSKNKFEKLVYLVGFIIRIYHDARSSECQFHAGSLPRKFKYILYVKNTAMFVGSSLC